MRRQILWWGLVIFIGASAAMADPGPTPSPPSVQGARHADTGTPGSTAGDTTFTLPAGWTFGMHGRVTVLHPVEPDLTLALVDVAAKDAAAAVAAGRAAVDPDFKRPLRITEPSVPRDGWEERACFDYEVSPNE